MTRLALLRHADTAWSVEGRIQGRRDIPLLQTATVPFPEAWTTASSGLVTRR